MCMIAGSPDRTSPALSGLGAPGPKAPRLHPPPPLPGSRIVYSMYVPHTESQQQHQHKKRLVHSPFGNRTYHLGILTVGAHHRIATPTTRQVGNLAAFGNRVRSMHEYIEQ